VFTFNKYIEILEMLVSKGYKIQHFDAPYSLSGVLYLRHDIDCDPFKALQLARLEKEHNLCSTYFFQIDSDFYNLFAKENQKILHFIARMGHRIGLHISPDYCTNLKELSLYIQTTHNYLTKLNLPCDPIFSFHRPGSFTGWERITIPNFLNVYSDEYFKKIKYVSDSNRRRFWETSLPEILNNEQAKSIQLLTHPIWWDVEELSPLEISYLLKNRTFSQLQKALKENIKLYKNIFQNYNDIEEELI
jgi:hypothetical protein